MTSVSLRDIAKSYGATPVLKGVSLEVAAGEFLTLVGPSGCGKSTLLRTIAGLETSDRGSVAIGDRVVDGQRPKARDVAMVFQSYALYPHMTVEGNLALPLRMRRLSAWQRLPVIGRALPGAVEVTELIAHDVREVARSLAIDGLLARKPSQLSGGQRQRVAVGRALVRRPKVFLMDEPLSNLDAKLRIEMRSELKELHRRLGITFIYVTHDQCEAMTLSDRVAVMMAGELVQVASPQDLYADPQDVRVATFIGSPGINLIGATVDANGTVRVAGTVFGLATGLAPGSVELGIRPEALHRVERAGVRTLSGRVHLVEHLGSDLLVHVTTDGAARPVVARMTPAQGRDLKRGDAVHVAVDAANVLMFDADGRRLRPPATPALLPQAHG